VGDNLSVAKGTQKDPRTLGELFFLGFDEASDIKFDRVIGWITEFLADTLRNSELSLADEQIEMIMDALIQKLPDYIQTCLHPNLAA
jgi:hypothetical protein